MVWTANEKWEKIIKKQKIKQTTQHLSTLPNCKLCKSSTIESWLCWKNNVIFKEVDDKIDKVVSKVDHEDDTMFFLENIKPWVKYAVCAQNCIDDLPKTAIGEKRVEILETFTESIIGFSRFTEGYCSLACKELDAQSKRKHCCL